MNDETKEKLKKYPSTEFFRVVDIIGVPHPFCITSRHVELASNKYMGQLHVTNIAKELESNGRPSCGMRGCNLMVEEHETALLVECKTKNDELLNKYLKSIVDMCESDGYAGFAFLDAAKGDNV